MTVKNTDIIKKAVRANFDKSAHLYEQFEQKHGLFEYLTTKLAEVCDISEGMCVADIGCGTGTSSYALREIVGAKGSVVGVDSSEKMLEIARTKIKSAGISNIDFISCDADEFDQKIDIKPDAVLYNAVIFLIPEPKRTLTSAYRTLTNKGIIGMNYLIGLYRIDNQILDFHSSEDDLFKEVKLEGKKFAPYGRKITDTKSLPGILKKIGFQGNRIQEGIIVRMMEKDEMKEFYSIPAQSAGLWPRNNYQERLLLLDSLVDHLQGSDITTYYQYWGWCIAEKE
ncbi:MAG: class I SAM-dependent methyltransferase [Candidatus Hodarchaeales archaeon]|jgi:ubiquinone/menaquinone biosynthesis C-methylase UbiE